MASNEEVRRLEDSEIALALAEARMAQAGLDDKEGLNAAEQRKLDRLAGLVELYEAEIERRRQIANAVSRVPRSDGDGAPAGSLARTTDASIYFPGSGASFFRDLYRVRQGDPDAQDRLLRHNREMSSTPAARQLAAIERRDISIGGGVADFIPPLYLQEDWAPLARAGRPLADFIGSRPLADSGMTLTVPKINTGVTVGMQANEGDAPSETDATDTTVTFGVKTAAGQQDLSVQLFERSSPGMDSVIADDLARAYATNVGSQIINGSDASGQVEGILVADGINAITYTDTSPTAPELYSLIADGIQRIHAARFLPPTVIVMAPRRWGWLTQQRDSNGRPFIVEGGLGPSNALASFGGVIPQGVVGVLQGLPVLVDPNIPTALGASTDEDRVLVLNTQDMLLFESPVRARVLSEVLSGTLQVRLQVYGYLAFTAERFPQSVSVISGTGLKTPVFGPIA